MENEYDEEIREKLTVS
jgi:hypothetical protein